MKLNMSREAGFSFAGKKIIALSLGLVLIAAACNKSQTNTTDNGATNQTDNSTANPNPTPAPSPSPTTAATSATINITADGFSPSSVTVKKGAVVTFVNTDSRQHWPASDPHPSHTDLPGFDALKALANGQSYNFTFSKVGTWGYHDHLNPFTRGSVTVVE